ncbi:aminopeptidase Y [Micromonospora inositola]|uniref:Aminopeptidase Y n=1 Tax=Micromonospora inositola TaxID=47865 RepID=A0A1C5JK43_9ACTN|nr:aminopeptidase Y [Micromonospora inositola]
MVSPRKALAGAAVGAVVGSMTLVGPVQADPNNNSVDKLTKAVTVQGVLRHLDAFQAIADAHGGTRASGTPGFAASADYVAGMLEQAGYQVTRQPFQFPFYEEFGSSFAQVAPNPTTYADGVDYDLMDYSAAGDVTGGVVPVDLALANPATSSSGCQPGDFTGLSLTGKVALMQRGECSFGQKATNARAAGAVGAIIMNQGNGTPATNPDRFSLFAGTLGGPVGIPVVSVSFAKGVEFASTAGLTVRITADATSEVRNTENVIAQSREGRTDNVVMAGAHLDSVPDGPGFNDNGTGSAAILEVALQMAKVKPNNAVRFAWWGAEEGGLLGSNHYVNSLSPAQRADIALYLNFDMVGSPNYVYGIYDGDDSAASGSGPGPAGSAQIEDVFEAFFASRGLPTVPADFTGRSDYGPFIAAGIGIPAGGLFTGAEGVKTAAEAALFGGVAGKAYDPCYHQACDSRTPVADGADAAVYGQLANLYGNVSTTALDVNSDAIATAVMTFAYDTSTVNGAPRAPGKSHAAGNSEDAHGHQTM